MRKLLGTALFLGVIYFGYIWLTGSDFFSGDIRFNAAGEYGATLGGRR